MLFITAPENAGAFDIPIHDDITTMTLDLMPNQVQSSGSLFKKEARIWIITGNRMVDLNQFDSSLHFDNEDFRGGSLRLTQLKEKIIVDLLDSSKDVRSVWVMIGGALHTLQDFYAHSNWVEMGNHDIHPGLGRQILGGLNSSNTPCPDDVGTLKGDGFKELTSGYFKLGFNVCDVPKGKCSHGLKAFGCPNGINKDSPARPGFTTASELAVRASLNYIGSILADQRVSQDQLAIKRLLGSD